MSISKFLQFYFFQYHKNWENGVKHMFYLKIKSLEIKKSYSFNTIHLKKSLILKEKHISMTIFFVLMKFICITLNYKFIYQF